MRYQFIRIFISVSVYFINILVDFQNAYKIRWSLKSAVPNLMRYAVNDTVLKLLIELIKDDFKSLIMTVR